MSAVALTHPGAAQDATARQRRNFYHLYADIAGYGLLAGSTLAFITIYAVRLGAASWQVGFLTAGPALVNLLITLPVGRWLAPRPLPRMVFLSSLLHRLFYPLLIPVALFVPNATGQIWLLLAVVLLSSIPGVPLSIGFNALFAEIVPEAWRGTVAGRRNALLALTMLVSTLLSGQILRLSEPATGYALVFVLGALGAGYSCYHLAQLRMDRRGPPSPDTAYQPLGDAARAGRPVLAPDAPLQRTFALRSLLHVPTLQPGSVLAPLRSSFGPFMLGLFFFHFAQFLPGPLFSLFWVKEARIDDAAISLLNAVHFTIMLLASLPLGRLTRRFGNRRLVAVGSLTLAAYPLLTAVSAGMVTLLIASIVGGAVWAILGGAISNRLLERIPAGDRPRHLALYNLALNAAILVGAMAGPALADVIGLRLGLLTSAGLRLLAGLVLWQVDR
ncbi:MAG: MFS transporter [Caldilineales bacterium]|nr:MFS transporter [Caldilineales bacterium]